MRLGIFALPLALSIGCSDTVLLEITTAALPNAMVGADYSFALAARGGEGAYTWSSIDALPSGLSLATAGTISGIPTTEGSYTFTVEVKEGRGEAARRALTLIVNAAPPAALMILTNDLLVGRVGDAYQRGLTASGGSGEYVWTISEGALPPGLTIAAAGTPATQIAGTPTTEGSFTFTVQVSDQAGMNASKQYTFEVAPEVKPAFEIQSFLLPDGVIGGPYQAVLQVNNATGGVTWTVDSGTFPPGLTLRELGDPHTEVSGTPTAEGEYEFVLRATDVGGASDTQSYTVQISPTFVPIEIETSSVPVAIVGVPVNFMIVARYGTGIGFTWSVTGGALPPGLMLGASGTPAALINGTAAMRGTFTATITVRDGNGDTDSREIDFVVEDPPLTIVTAALPGGDVGLPYSETIIAAGGSGAGHSWRISAGSLPPGLVLQPSGVDNVTIDGTPTQEGSYDFIVEVTTSGFQIANQAYQLPIYGPVAITTLALASAEVGSVYTASISAQGGNGGYSYLITSGALPPGLGLDPSGLIGGVPTALGDYTFTIQVRDQRGQSGTGTLTIAVYDPLRIPSVTLPRPSFGTAYTATVGATGGLVPYTFAVTGALPVGLALTNSAGFAEISGSSTDSGPHDFTLSVTDGRGITVARNLTIDVATQLAIDTLVLPGAPLGQAYTASITASGGSLAGYTWSVITGVLPAGLSITANATPAAMITGSATALGTRNFTVRVTDSAGSTATRALSIQVLAPLTIDTPTLASRIECSARGELLSASGGSGAGYTWTASGLPPGVTTGPAVSQSFSIFGRATASGDYAITVGVRDSAGLRDERVYFLTVDVDPFAQRFALLVGDLLVNNDTEVYVTDACGEQAVGLTALNPSLPGVADASTDPDDAVFSPDQRKVAFIGDFVTDTVDEVFLSTAITPSVRPRINGPLVASGDVLDLFWSPDSSLLVYLADQNVDGIDELFVVDATDPTSPSLPVQVNAALGANSDVTHVSFAPDGSGLIYRADVTDNVFELFWVDLSIPTLPGAPVRLNAALTAPRTCDPEIAWSTSGNGVAFRCDATTAGVFELWFVRFTAGAPGVAQRASGTMVANGDVLAASFAFSPDGTGVAYLADQNTDELVELYVAVTFGGSIIPGVRAMNALAANEDVTSFRFGPDGLRGLLRGDLDSDEIFELYLLDSSGGFPATPVRLNGAMVTGGDVDPTDFAFSPDGDRVAYLADQSLDEHPELFLVDVSGAVPSAPLRASPVLGVAAGTSVDSFTFAPNSARIAMRGDFFVASQIELAAASVTTGTAQVVNLALPTGGDVTFFEWRADGEGILFEADMTADNDTEAWSVDLSGPTPSTPLRMHAPVPVNGDLEFLWLEP